MIRQPKNSNGGDRIKASLTRVEGSSPREVGTQMLISGEAIFGTIGGGRLEYMVIDRARQMLAETSDADQMDIPLGPEIGQCCGGRVSVSLTRINEADSRILIDEAGCTTEAPHVYIFGSGHVGRAIAAQSAHLPLRTVLIDTRADQLALSRAEVDKRECAIPEAEIAAAPAGSAFIVVTHDHGLDFLLASAALARGDARYVGLIGSKTKRARFESWCRTECDGLDPRPLICPIGANPTMDKRPSVIATFTVSEVLNALL